MLTRGEGELAHLSTYAKSSFYHALLSMAMTFIAVLKITCYDYFPLSNLLQSFSLWTN